MMHSYSCSSILFYHVAFPLLFSCASIAWRVACFLMHQNHFGFWSLCIVKLSFAPVGHCLLHVILGSWIEQVCVDVDSCLCFGRWDSQVESKMKRMMWLHVWSHMRTLIRRGSAVHMALLVHPCLQRLFATHTVPSVSSSTWELPTYPAELERCSPTRTLLFVHCILFSSCMALLHINRLARCLLAFSCTIILAFDLFLLSSCLFICVYWSLSFAYHDWIVNGTSLCRRGLLFMLW